MEEDNSKKDKNNEPVLYLASNISEEAIAEATKVMRGNAVDKGPLADKFEEQFSPLVGVPYAVSTSSCTAALHISLLTAGVREGDEVITTALTYTASNLAILYTGARPVFVDLKSESLNMDPRAIEEKITHKTKAILVVHLAGVPCDMDEIRKIAEEYKLPVIEDAAQALGATYKDKKIGQMSDFTCFSFDPYKPLPTGAGGGMVVTHNADFDAKLRRLRYYGFQLHGGFDYYKKYAVEELGMKYYMKEISAATALAGLSRFHEMLEWRKHIVKRYLRELQDVPGMRLTQYPMDRSASYYTFIVFVTHRTDFFSAMHSRGVHVGLPAVRNDIAPIFGGKRCELPVMNELEHQYVGLPVHNKMTEKDISRVISAVRKGW